MGILVRTSTRRIALLLVLVAILLSGFVHAETPTTMPARGPGAAPVASLSTRTGFTISNAAALAALQKQIQKVTPAAIAATVGVRIGNAQGSGVVVSADGYVMSVGHVVDQPNLDAVIIFADGTRKKGKTLGLDKDADTGLIKITDPGPFVFAPVGTSKTLEPGEWTIAIGHPGGYIRNRPPVVRIGRVIINYDDMIVTDNLLVGGDSGGPLFDLDGRIIGLHSRISQSTTRNMHVPVDEYIDTWDKLAAGVNIGGPQPFVSFSERPFLGLLGSDDPMGFRITAVRDGSPAAQAGLKEGDILLDIDGEGIKSIQTLGLVLQRHKIGDELNVKIMRGSTVNLLKATLGRTP